MDEETLLAYPKKYGADGGRNTVEVTVDDNGDFTDNYTSIEIRDYCEKLYNDFIRDYFKSDKAIVFISHFECEVQNVNEIKNNCFKNKVGGENQIFISDEICNKTEFENFVADYYPMV